MPTISAQEDLAGLKPVYFNPDALDRGFATAPENLVDNPRLDEISLAAAILWPGVSPLTGNYTYYEGVSRLLPGDKATISEGRLNIQSGYPAENLDATFDDTALRVGTALKQDAAQIVAQWPGTVSSDFSGGFDSPTLGLAAAEQCLTWDNILGLVQYSREYPAGDISYARTLARLSSRLILRELVTTADGLPFSHKPPADISPSEPYRGTAIFARENGRLAEARSHHMTGDGGDALFDPEPIPILVDLLRSGSHAQAYNLALRIGRDTLSNPESILSYAKTKARTNLSESYDRVARQLTGDNLLQPAADWLPSLGVASTWLTPRMREAVAARAKEFACQSPDISFGAFMTRQVIRDSGDAHRHLRMLAERHGVDVIAPYLGETVLRSVISLPSQLRIKPGHYKSLLQAASQAVSLAPAEIFKRQTKGAYSAESLAGFRAALPRIRKLVENSRLACMGIIDPEAVLASLSGKRPPLASLTQLLAMEAWLAYLGIDAPEERAPVTVRRHTLDEEPVSEKLELPKGYFALPPSLHVAPSGDSGLVAFDYKQGKFLVLPALNGSARLIMRTLVETNSPQITLEAMQAEYPGVPVEQLNADLTTTIHDLCNQGWLRAIDASDVQVIGLIAKKLPSVVAKRVIEYVQSLHEGTERIDAHHFASVVSGYSVDLLTANDRAAEIVRNGREITANELAVGEHGVVGVLKSAHGLTHGLWSVIGLGGGDCVGVIAEDGNVGIAPINNYVTYSKDWLKSIGFAGDMEKVRLYAKRSPN